MDSKNDILKNVVTEIEEEIEEKKPKIIPVAVKVFFGIFVAYSLVTIVSTGANFWSYLLWVIRTGANGAGTSTAFTLALNIVFGGLLSLGNLTLGILLLMSKRKSCARFIYWLYVVIGVEMVTEVLLEGIHIKLLAYLVGLVVLIALQIYLDPQLTKERKDYRKKIEGEWKEEQEAGVIGFDTTGKGAIEINFFNIFWIFIFCSVVGLLGEEIYHFLVVVPGEIQDRAGVLFGPFSPIYGFGAVIMSVMLNRLHKAPIIVTFVASAIIGGLFEVAVAYFMQYSFGAVAWDYSNEVLPLFGGRTCLKFMVMWGLAGCIWLKVMMPTVVKFVNKIPWNWRYSVTTVCTALMLVDAIMTLQSLDCWYMRVSLGEDAANASNITQFYAKYFDDDYMNNRFESMTIVPEDSVRGPH